jgi:hypothetical protein
MNAPIKSASAVQGAVAAHFRASSAADFVCTLAALTVYPNVSMRFWGSSVDTPVLAATSLVKYARSNASPRSVNAFWSCKNHPIDENKYATLGLASFFVPQET